jgi:hypothetical protein
VWFTSDGGHYDRVSGRGSRLGKGFLAGLTEAEVEALSREQPARSQPIPWERTSLKWV